MFTATSASIGRVGRLGWEKFASDGKSENGVLHGNQIVWRGDGIVGLNIDCWVRLAKVVLITIMCAHQFRVFE
jgi:hypothetical protein